MAKDDVTVPEIDPLSLDLTQRVADLDAIQAANPHRHEMVMLTAVVPGLTAKAVVPVQVPTSIVSVPVPTTVVAAA